MREGSFEFPHPGVVRVLRVRDTGLGRAGGLHRQQLRGEVGGGLLGGLARLLPAASAELGEFRDGPADADVARQEMRLPHGEVQHRFQGELQADEILGAPVVLVRLDAAEETDALRGVHERVAVGEFAEVEGAADGGADGGAAARQDGERTFASAEELAFGQQEQAVLEQAGQLVRGDEDAAAEASGRDAWREAADLGVGDLGVEPIDGAVGVTGEQAGTPVLRQRSGGPEEGGAGLGAVRGRADEQGFGGRRIERVRHVADRSIIGLLEHEFVDLGRVQFGAEDVLVATVDGDDERVGRQVPEERGLGRRAGIIARGADDEAIDFAFAALRRGIERSERFDDVAEEIDAHGHLRVQRIDVEDAAAERVFAGLLAEGLVGIAEIFGEALREITQGELLALADDDLGLGRGFGGGRPAGERPGRAGDEQRTLRVMAAVAQKREHAEQVAVRFEGRDGCVGLGQGAGDRLGGVEQRQQLGGLFGEGFRGAEVRGQEDDYASLGAFRTGAGRPGVRWHAGQGTAWLSGHAAIEAGRTVASNPTPYLSTTPAISSQSSSICDGFFTGRPASANQ